MQTAAWKPGYESLHKADPNKVANEITAIGKTATPQQIVDAAREKSTELHKCFTWDDKVAAEKYRIVEARELVRHLVIVDEVTNEPTQIRMFYQGEENGYQRTEFILQKPDEYTALLRRALKELKSFQEKYANLSELAPVFAAISEVA